MPRRRAPRHSQGLFSICYGLDPSLSYWTYGLHPHVAAMALPVRRIGKRPLYHELEHIVLQNDRQIFVMWVLTQDKRYMLRCARIKARLQEVMENGENHDER